MRPPMGAPVSLKSQRASFLPGSITYLNDMQVGAKFAPLYEVQPAWLGQLRGEIAADSSIIDTAFFVDLFLMISQMDIPRGCEGLRINCHSYGNYGPGVADVNDAQTVNVGCTSRLNVPTGNANAGGDFMSTLIGHMLYRDIWSGSSWFQLTEH